MKYICLLTSFLIIATGCSGTNEEKNVQETAGTEKSTNFEKIVLKGKVFDHNKQPLPMANVVTYIETEAGEKPIGTASNMEGEYFISFDINQDSIKTDVIYSFRSYKIDTLSISAVAGDTVDLDYTFRIE